MLIKTLVKHFSMGPILRKSFDPMKHFIIIGVLLLSGCAQYETTKEAVTIAKRTAGVKLYERVCDLTYQTERYIIIKKDLSRENFRDFCKRSEKR